MGLLLERDLETEVRKREDEKRLVVGDSKHAEEISRVLGVDESILA